MRLNPYLNESYLKTIAPFIIIALVVFLLLIKWPAAQDRLPSVEKSSVVQTETNIYTPCVLSYPCQSVEQAVDDMETDLDIMLIELRPISQIHTDTMRFTNE